LPILVAQAYSTRKRTPRLPDASGPPEGSVRGYTDGSSAPLTMIALGESTVAGVGAVTHETALTGQVAKALAEKTGRTVSWVAVARSGITAREGLSELVPKLMGRRADLVVIALGVNDSIAFHTSPRWARDLERLIEGVRGEVGDALILLAGVPPLQNFPALPQPLSSVLGARSTFLDHASARLAKRMQRVIHVPFVMEKDRRLFCADGFHPSELGYTLWAEQLAAAFMAKAT
jgi:lysophospholipase L1-like esterase